MQGIGVCNTIARKVGSAKVLTVGQLVLRAPVRSGETGAIIGICPA
jgi:hypothetical protein